MIKIQNESTNFIKIICKFTILVIVWRLKINFYIKNRCMKSHSIQRYWPTIISVKFQITFWLNMFVCVTMLQISGKCLNRLKFSNFTDGHNMKELYILQHRKSSKRFREIIRYKIFFITIWQIYTSWFVIMNHY